MNVEISLQLGTRRTRTELSSRHQLHQLSPVQPVPVALRAPFPPMGAASAKMLVVPVVHHDAPQSEPPGASIIRPCWPTWCWLGHGASSRPWDWSGSLWEASRKCWRFENTTEDQQKRWKLGSLSGLLPEWPKSSVFVWAPVKQMDQKLTSPRLNSLGSTTLEHQASPGPTKPEMELMLVSISTGVVSLASRFLKCQHRSTTLKPDLGFTVFSGKAGVSSGQAGWKSANTLWSTASWPQVHPTKFQQKS